MKGIPLWQDVSFFAAVQAVLRNWREATCYTREEKRGDNLPREDTGGEDAKAAHTAS